jgi:serine/threonine-protein kinase HipA
LLETPQGDYRLSPAYDLLNSRMHVSDTDFALDDGLLPRNLGQGKISAQFATLAAQAGIPEKLALEIMALMQTRSDAVEKMVAASFLGDRHQRSYWQGYQGRLKQLLKR